MIFFNIVASASLASKVASPVSTLIGDFIANVISPQQNEQYTNGDVLTLNSELINSIPAPIITDISSVGFDYNIPVSGEGISGINIYVNSTKHNRTPRYLFKDGYDVSDVVSSGGNFSVQFSYIFDDASEGELSEIQNVTLSASTSYDYAKDVVLAFEGNSLTYGLIGDSTLEQYYPNQVKNYFDTKFNSLAFSSTGGNGKTLKTMSETYVTNVGSKYQAGKTNIAIAWEDINSLGATDGDVHYNMMVQYFQKIKDTGFQHAILITGYHPRQHSYSASLIEGRKKFIERVLKTPINEVPWDYHIDLNEAPNIGGLEGQLQNSYFFDAVHLNMIGYDVVADEVIKQINDIMKI